MVQLLAFYFPENPTYGPASPDGQNRDTNGLEGSWWQRQKSITRAMKITNNSRLNSLKLAVQNDTHNSSDMKTEPVATMDDWNHIFAYSKNQMKIPGHYHFLTFYSTSTAQHLSTKEDVQKHLTDLTVYIPTWNNLNNALSDAKRAKITIDYPLLGRAELIADSSNRADRLFNECMGFKKTIREILNKELHGKFKQCMNAVKLVSFGLIYSLL